MATIEEATEIFRNIAPHVETWLDPETPKVRVWFLKNPANQNDIGMEIRFVDGQERSIESFEDIADWKYWRSVRLKNYPDEYCLPLSAEQIETHISNTSGHGEAPDWERYEVELRAAS